MNYIYCLQSILIKRDVDPAIDQPILSRRCRLFGSLEEAKSEAERIWNESAKIPLKWLESTNNEAFALVGHVLVDDDDDGFYPICMISRQEA